MCQRLVFYYQWCSQQETLSSSFQKVQSSAIFRGCSNLLENIWERDSKIKFTCTKSDSSHNQTMHNWPKPKPKFKCWCIEMKKTDKKGLTHR
jgi:hypothetical protein